MSRRDVVMVTIDSWRADAVERMDTPDRLVAAGYEQSEAIAGAAATHGAFPPLLASTHAIHAYTDAGQLRPTVETMSDRLAEVGYATAGFVASNPFLSKYDDRFDRFWNDELGDPTGDWHGTLDRVRRFLTLQKRVPAPAVAARAREWFETTPPPRFLWIHLMDVHGPYFPGLRRARRVGLARTYATLSRYHIADTEHSVLKDDLRALYRACVDRLDASLSSVVEFVPDDAVVVCTADHGEEFDHGYHGHGQLYDECVRVPLFARGIDAPLAETTVRHVDLPPTILDSVDVGPPSDWRGSRVDGTDRPALLANHSPALGQTSVGVRTARHKYLRAYDDTSWSVDREELYDLRADPDEQSAITDESVRSRLSDTVDEFLTGDGADLDVIRDTSTGIDADVHDRLAELGYVE